MGVVPYQAIGLPVAPSTTLSMKSIYLNVDLSKKEIVAQIMESGHYNYFTKTEIEQLYDLSVQHINNSISRQELIDKISNLRGGEEG